MTMFDIHHNSRE